MPPGRVLLPADRGGGRQRWSSVTGERPDAPERTGASTAAARTSEPPPPGCRTRDTGPGTEGRPPRG